MGIEVARLVGISQRAEDHVLVLQFDVGGTVKAIPLSPRAAIFVADQIDNWLQMDGEAPEEGAEPGGDSAEGGK